ncbi:unnamed protein product [Phytophthora fragariaefolia]|uniref:Unnamed protein product n=1 Tax=Phytophthora fragariaefolia TaxID=1490495 RepID=A0A9W6XST7_9STRA|nr:unnamed protein product [Phytophthora fragariaefolia]
MILDISSGESRGYWKYHVPDKKFKQAKAVGKINNAKATLLFDSGAEVSILDTAFARKVGCYVDNSQTLQCEGVGRSPSMAEGRTRLKITLAGSLVYCFDAWVGPPTGGQDLILGMDFMVPAGIRLDLADGTICLPDEVRIQLAGRRPLYGDKVEQVTMGGYCEIDIGGSEEVRLRTRPSDRQKLWRGDRWVPTYVVGPGRSCSLRLTNVSERKLILHGNTKIAIWFAGDRVPRLPGYVSVGSRRYAEWQNLAYQVTTDENGVTPKLEEVEGPAVECPLYQTPTSISRPPICPVGTAAARQIKGRASWHRLSPQRPRLPLQYPRAAAPVGRGKLHSDHNITSAWCHKRSRHMFRPRHREPGTGGVEPRSAAEPVLAVRTKRLGQSLAKTWFCLAALAMRPWPVRARIGPISFDLTTSDPTLRVSHSI